MKNTTLSLALFAAMFALPMTALAQEAAAPEEAESPFSWSIDATSDYVFRGVSQSDEDPALQIGADFSFLGGFYVGAWASNVDFGTGGPDFELDTFIGWNTDLNDSFNLDLMVNRYNYIGSDENIDYNEFIAALAYDETYTFTFGYTNDVYNLNEDSFYYNLAGSWGIGNGFALDAAYGLTTFSGSTGFEDYQDWSIGVSREFGAITAALGYYDTNSDGNVNFGDLADDRFVLTFSIGG
jgi:uncharacterized protein (TIGR02001 family)